MHPSSGYWTTRSGVGGLVGVAGILVPAGDVERLRAVVQELLGDAEWRARLGAGARRAAEERLAPEACAAALVRAYGAALSPPA